jgi:ubiquitin-protein ligase
MTSPRLKRLANDYQELRLRFDGHPHIQVQPLGPVPAERYRVVYKGPSLRLNPSNQPIVMNVTVVDFMLPINYPREKPHAVALEPVFHPNFGEYVCIADFWSPAQKLADIILDVGEMLQWQKYNIKSPLNAVAADWAVKHKDDLPVGDKNLNVGTSAPVVSINTNQSGEK